jgi:hypothetical protein
MAQPSEISGIIYRASRALGVVREWPSSFTRACNKAMSRTSCGMWRVRTGGTSFQ